MKRVRIFKMQTIAALVNGRTGKRRHCAGVMPGETEIILTTYTVQDKRLIGPAVDESSVSTSMIVACVEEVDADEKAAAVDAGDWILTVASSFLLGVEDGVERRECIGNGLT